MDRVYIDNISTQSKPVEAYSADELNAVFDVLTDDYLEPAVILMAFCGLRKEEALALDWRDIAENGVVDVYRAYTCVGHKVKIKDVKAHEARLAYLTDWAHERMEQLRGKPTAPVCACAGQTDPCHPNTATKRFRRIIERAGIRYLPIGDLRHACATIALSLGVDVALVSKMLGHRQVSTTVNRYIKPMEMAKRDATATLSAALRPRNLPKSPKTMVNFG
jgi:integrase